MHLWPTKRMWESRIQAEPRGGWLWSTIFSSSIWASRLAEASPSHIGGRGQERASLITQVIRTFSLYYMCWCPFAQNKSPDWSQWRRIAPCSQWRNWSYVARDMDTGRDIESEPLRQFTTACIDLIKLNDMMWG